MRLNSVVEARDEYYAFELARAAWVLVRDILDVKAGQCVILTVDTQTDSRVVDATAKAVYAAGASPIVVSYHTQRAPQMELPAPIAAAVRLADIWIELAVSYTVYTGSWQAAVDAGVQYCGLNGLDVDGMVRCIGRQNIASLDAIASRVKSLLAEAKVRVTSAAGTDIAFSNAGVPVGQFEMRSNADKVPIMLGGQVSWAPVEASMHGTLVADGILSPPTEVGILQEPVTFLVEEGRITRITGGREAHLLQAWLDERNDPNLTRIAHVSMGFNPGVPVPTGRILEDERAYGDIDFGFGAWIGRPAAGHFDFTCRKVSVMAGDVTLQRDGRLVHPELVALL